MLSKKACKPSTSSSDGGDSSSSNSNGSIVVLHGSSIANYSFICNGPINMQTSSKVQLSCTANDDDADEDPVKP